MAIQWVLDFGAGHDVIKPRHQTHHFTICPQCPAQYFDTEKFSGVSFVGINHFQAIKLRGETNDAVIGAGRVGFTREEIDHVVRVEIGC